MKAIFGLVLFAFALHLGDAANLKVSGTHLMYNNTQVFLSGANIAWYNYARDFGSGAYASVRSKYEGALDEINKAGGNVIRVWVHIDGQYSPKFDSNGLSTGADTTSLITELGELLDYAAKKDIFVILCLWNLAVAPTQMIKMYTNDTLLQSYLDKVLTPMAKGLANKPALAAYDIINEPIGGLKQSVTDSNPCYDTNHLLNSGADWANTHLLAKDVLKFINHHADAIKTAAPNALVTVGESGEVSDTTICTNCRDIYTNQCLTGAGGKAKGTIDFYQMHSYVWQGKFSDTSPFKKKAADYKQSKPIVVGEFASSCSESKNPVTDYEYLYNSGYAGALAWQYDEGGDCADKRVDMDKGMSSIKDMTSNGHIKIKIL